VHDTADLEERGIPSAFIATVEFSDGAIGQAKAIGADPKAIYTEHPIQDRTDEEMVGIADRIWEEVLSGLVAEG
jgi:hypothetical protein